MGITFELKDDRVLSIAALATMVVLAWTYLLRGAGIEMPTMDAGPRQWDLSDATLIFLMWAVMMVAMMLPSVAKVVLLAAVLDRSRGWLVAACSTMKFVAGYLAIWLAFSAAATATQRALDGSGLLSETMSTSNGMLAGSMLVYAGIYEWNPLKQTCLTHCRAPEHFLARHWWRGPFETGLRHGLFCLGCCWMLMGLLFVGGLMNIAWIAAITAAIVVEKTMPRGIWASWIIGTTLILVGVITLAVPGFDWTTLF